MGITCHHCFLQESGAKALFWWQLHKGFLSSAFLPVQDTALPKKHLFVFFPLHILTSGPPLQMTPSKLVTKPQE